MNHITQKSVILIWKNQRRTEMAYSKKDWIDQSDFNTMNAEGKKAGPFYCNFKVHGQHEHLPSPRPIVSGFKQLQKNM